MKNAKKIMDNILALVQDLPLAKRRVHAGRVVRLARSLGLDPQAYTFIELNVSKWPGRVDRCSTEIRFEVDFGHGSDPDYRLYGATFDEIAKLLCYTQESCRVIFINSKYNRVDRTQRPTRLGPCIITRLPSAVDPKSYPKMRRLRDREEDLKQKRLMTRNRLTYSRTE